MVAMPMNDISQMRTHIHSIGNAVCLCSCDTTELHSTMVAATLETLA